MARSNLSTRAARGPFLGLGLGLSLGLVFGCKPEAPANPDASTGETRGVDSTSSDQPELNNGSAEVAAGPAWFRTVKDSGIDFVHSSGVSDQKEFPAANGSGMGALDYDLDGRIDLYFASGCKFPVDLSDRSTIDRAYRNLGAFQFADITDLAHLGFNGYSAGVTVGDYDSDGFTDVYVACYGANVLYHNQGDGSFVRREIQASVADEGWATSAGFFDGDADGDLDLYVCNYGHWSLETNQYCHSDGNPDIRLFCSPKSIQPAHGVYYVNQGDGTFVEQAEAAGFRARAGRAQGVVMADLDGDRRTDVYIGNDLNANSLFMSNGDGTFRDETELSGVAYSQAGLAQAGMGVDAGDVNGDGKFELYVTNFKGEYSTLYENRGRGLFFDVSMKRGVGRDTIPYVSWGATFGDFDLDGWMDLLVVNGHVDPNRHLAGEDAPYRNPALLFRNQSGAGQSGAGQSGSGERGSFVGVHAAAGDYFQELHSSRGLIVADFDEDGDLDFVACHQDESPSMVENLCIGGDDTADLVAGSSVTVRFVGTTAHRDAIGSDVMVKWGDREFRDQVTGGGSYLSTGDYRLSCPIDRSDSLPVIEARFSGQQSLAHQLEGAVPLGSYVLIEGSDPSQAPAVWRVDDVR